MSEPRVIVHWREKVTHLVRHVHSHFLHFDHTVCGEDVAHDLRYVAPKGTQVTCLSCIAAEPP